jgi:Ca2+-transporting ATPase
LQVVKVLLDLYTDTVDTLITGLTTFEAQERLEKWGNNEIAESHHTSPLVRFVKTLKSNFIVYLLLFAAVVSLLVGELVTGIVIMLVLSLIVTISFVQEYKADVAIEALKNMMVLTCTVIRDGREQQIETRAVVPGDVVVIRSGDRVPADGKIVHETALRVDESILTGESAEQTKRALKSASGTSKNESILFMGSYVVNGKCTFVVTHTGMNTKFGQISTLITETVKELPLQKKVNAIAGIMVVVAISISIFISVVLLFQAKDFSSATLTHILVLAIALAVSAFPEGLPVVLMTSLAAGTTRMAKKNAIVNRMSIIETLGETTVICTDKTGTLTKGEMTVKKIVLDGKVLDVSGVGYSNQGEFTLNNQPVSIEGNRQLSELLRCCVVCNSASIQKTETPTEYKALGSHTEVALLILAAKAKIYREDLQHRILEEIPFTPETKIMFTKVEIHGRTYLYAKGAPEVIVKLSRYQFKGNERIALDSKERESLLAQTTELSDNSYRTLALAYCELKPTHEKAPLTFLGIVGIEDPPREGVKETIEVCTAAGIRVKMITGDHKTTAVAIATQIGLIGKAYEGDELDAMSDSELAVALQEAVIFARVRPEHKLRIVNTLKQLGEVVTMTGDGVNDAPALKEANIGVAMGKSGTDVSRSVADLTLKDDNFVTIVEAIREGRTIFNNLRKFVTYQLSCNYAELMILLFSVIFSPLLGWQTPILLSLHILFMNLVTDDLPAITLAVNHSSKDVMSDRPRRNANILTRSLYASLVISGMTMGAMSLAAYYISFNIFGNSADVSRTTLLFTLIVLEIAGAFIYRSFRFPVLTRSLFVNKYLFLASAVSLGITLLVIYTPLNKAFQTAPIGIIEIIIAVTAGLIYVLLSDIFKAINERMRLVNFS